MLHISLIPFNSHIYHYFCQLNPPLKTLMLLAPLKCWGGFHQDPGEDRWPGGFVEAGGWGWQVQEGVPWSNDHQTTSNNGAESIHQDDSRGESLYKNTANTASVWHFLALQFFLLVYFQQFFDLHLLFLNSWYMFSSGLYPYTNSIVSGVMSTDLRRVGEHQSPLFQADIDQKSQPHIQYRVHRSVSNNI